MGTKKGKEVVEIEASGGVMTVVADDNIGPVGPAEVRDAASLPSGCPPATPAESQAEIERLAVRHYALFDVLPMAPSPLFAPNVELRVLSPADQLNRCIDDLHAAQHARAASGGGAPSQWQNAMAHIRSALACLDDQARIDEELRASVSEKA